MGTPVDEVQAESGGSRGCVFAAIGLGCLGLILILGFAGATLFAFRSAPSASGTTTFTVPMASTRSSSNFPTAITTQNNQTTAGLNWYSNGSKQRLEIGNLRMEFPGQNLKMDFVHTVMISGDTGSDTRGATFGDLKIESQGKSTAINVSGVAMTIRDEVLSIDGQTFDIVNSPLTVMSVDAKGKVSARQIQPIPEPVKER